MSIFTSIRQAVSRQFTAADGYPATSFEAASALPPAEMPKPPKGQQTFPGYRRQVKPSTSAQPRTERRTASTDLLTLRNAATTKGVIRNFAIASPDLSATTFSFLRVGIPEAYTLVARDMDGTINEKATQLAMEILRRVTYVPDYSLGFNALSSVHALACSLGKELMWYGSAALEVGLDKSRLPINFVPVHTPSIEFTDDDKGLKPTQKVGGETINLDIPTFVYTSIDQDQLDPYSSSWMEAAIQPVLADVDFMNDLRRVLKQAIHPRITATLFEEKIRKAAPLEISHDPVKLAEYMGGILAEVTDVINNSAPEDAYVTFDLVEYGYLEGNAPDIAGNIKAVQDYINAKMSTGAKAMPAVLGRGGTGTASSTDALLFVKSADVIRRSLNELFSRALTVSCRLFGEDVYVEFKYATIDLRPESELEAYKAMRQSRILELLSLGLMPDAEACIELTGNLPPPGMKPLSGTMFKQGTTDTQNPDSQTSNMGNELKPKTPASPKSPSK